MVMQSPCHLNASALPAIVAVLSEDSEGSDGAWLAQLNSSTVSQVAPPRTRWAKQPSQFLPSFCSPIGPSGELLNTAQTQLQHGFDTYKIGGTAFLGLNQLMKQLQLLPKWVKKMPKVVGVQKIFARSTFKFTIIGQNLSQTRK